MQRKLMFPDLKKPAIAARLDGNAPLSRSRQLNAQRVKIAISGKSGCGNSTLCAMLAERCNVPCINYTFRDLAAAHGISLEEVTRRAQHDPTIDWYIDSKLSTLFAQNEGILGSRLAVWLGAGVAFTVYLEASLEVRAQRIAQREQRDYDVVYAQTQSRDALDTRRYYENYAIDITDYGFVDIVCNCENRDPESLATMILDAYSKLNV